MAFISPLDSSANLFAETNLFGTAVRHTDSKSFLESQHRLFDGLKKKNDKKTDIHKGADCRRNEEINRSFEKQQARWPQTAGPSLTIVLHLYSLSASLSPQCVY